jgi:conjugal transfer pilus assembly protein TrbC
MEKKRLLYFIAIILIPSFLKAQEIMLEPAGEDVKSAQELLRSIPDAREDEAKEVIRNFLKPDEGRAGETINSIQPGTIDTGDDKTDAPAHKGHLYYFFSFSMPQEGLKSLLPQMEKTGAVMVLRGMKKGSGMRGTMMQIAEFLKRSNKSAYQVEVWIHPVLFRCYNVEAVPQIVYVPEGSDPEKCWESFIKVRGAVSLDYALSLIAREDGGAESYLKLLRESFFEKD